jgi:hypothetical protein
MVIATASAETIHKDLKSLPGGWVEARRLTYGEKLQRRAMVSGMKIKMQDRKSKKNDDMEGEMNLVNEAASLFDFQKCIMDHNLEAEITGPIGDVNSDEPVSNTRKLDLTTAADIKKLDPRAGEEIDTWLSEINNFDEDEEGED